MFTHNDSSRPHTQREVHTISAHYLLTQKKTKKKLLFNNNNIIINSFLSFKYLMYQYILQRMPSRRYMGGRRERKGIGFQPEISFPFGCDDQITSATTSRHYNSF